MNQNLINNLAQPVNHVASAYEARTGQLEAKREQDQAKEAAAQQQRDNDMLKVFEFAGDGNIEQAKYLAQSKGLEIPEDIYSNADFAKGLSTAGSFYGDDPAGAQRFTMAWMQTQDAPSYADRVLMASQMAGAPIDPSDRNFQQKIRFEQWKLQNLPQTGGEFSLSPGQTRYDAQGKVVANVPAEPPVSLFQAQQSAINAARSGSIGRMAPEEEQRIIDEATARWNAAYSGGGGQAPTAPQNNTVSNGLVGGDPLQTSINAINQQQSQIGANPYQRADIPAQPMQPAQPEPQPQASDVQRVHAVQQALINGHSSNDIVQKLIQSGYTEQQATDLVIQAGG